MRLLSTAAVLAVGVWGLGRFLSPAFVRRLPEIEVAQRIEQRFPQLCDRLSSAVAFLGQSEDQPTAGSPDLRRAVVATAVTDLERWNFADCLDTRRPRRIAVIAAAVCAVVCFVAAWDWPSAALAFRRLAMPWRVEPWPRRNQLQFVKAPTRLAFGSDFEVELVDRHGRLPPSVQIHIWPDGDGANQIQTKDMKFFQDRMVYRWDDVRRPFRYRAVGGDDDTMPWRTLELVEPPQVTSLQIRLHPPAYTGWPAVASGENIRALEGTAIEVAGQVNRPAGAVRLRMDKPDSAGAVSGRLSEDGLRFTIGPDAQPPWRATQSGTYWFEVTDAEGLRGGDDRRWNLRAVPDAPPTVVLEQPAANTFVTADAALPLVGVVKDDLAIHSISIRFTRSDSPHADEQQTVEIVRGPDAAPRQENGPAEVGGGPADTRRGGIRVGAVEVERAQAGRVDRFRADGGRLQAAVGPECDAPLDDHLLERIGGTHRVAASVHSRSVGRGPAGAARSAGARQVVGNRACRHRHAGRQRRGLAAGRRVEAAAGQPPAGRSARGRRRANRGPVARAAEQSDRESGGGRAG